MKMLRVKESGVRSAVFLLDKGVIFTALCDVAVKICPVNITECVKMLRASKAFVKMVVFFAQGGSITM